MERNVVMSPTCIKDGHLLYHQTELKNLQSILETGLLSRAMLTSQNLPFRDVADPQIIEGRVVEGWDNYVPFHFHPRTTFDYRIRYDHPNDAFVFLCMYRNVAERCGALILTAHPLSNMKPQAFQYSDGFNQIDWDTMELTQGEVGYNSQIRMAECLIRDKVDIRNICIIYVKSLADKEVVERMLREKNIRHIKVYIGETFFGTQQRMIMF